MLQNTRYGQVYINTIAIQTQRVLNGVIILALLHHQISCNPTLPNEKQRKWSFRLHIYLASNETSYKQRLINRWPKLILLETCFRFLLFLFLLFVLPLVVVRKKQLLENFVHTVWGKAVKKSKSYDTLCTHLHSTMTTKRDSYSSSSAPSLLLSDVSFWVILSWHNGDSHYVTGPLGGEGGRDTVVTPLPSR